MKLNCMMIILILAQIACQTTSAQISAFPSATETVTPMVSAEPTATSKEPSAKCYTVTAEEGLHVRALPKYDSPITAILTAGQGVTATRQSRDIHGNTWLFIGEGWSRADWMIETECKP